MVAELRRSSCPACLPQHRFNFPVDLRDDFGQEARHCRDQRNHSSRSIVVRTLAVVANRVDIAAHMRWQWRRRIRTARPPARADHARARSCMGRIESSARERSTGPLLKCPPSSTGCHAVVDHDIQTFQEAVTKCGANARLDVRIARLIGWAARDVRKGPRRVGRSGDSTSARSQGQSLPNSFDDRKSVKRDCQKWSQSAIRLGAAGSAMPGSAKSPHS